MHNKQSGERSRVHSHYLGAVFFFFLSKIMLSYTVARVCTSPRSLTWFTRPFFLVRGWGLGTRLVCASFFPRPVIIVGGMGTEVHVYTT